MRRSEFLGELEEMVLLAAVRLGEGAYGAVILRELDEEAGRDVPLGSVYMALERLESKGLVASRAEEPTPGRGGRPRRMLVVTEAGVAALRRTHRVRQHLLDGLDEVFQP